MSRLFNLTVELKLIFAALKTRVVSEVYHTPRAYVQIEDTDSSLTTMASCSEFRVTISRDLLGGEFSCTIQQADIWNPRTSSYENLLNPDKRKRVHIYYGQKVSGSLHYVKVFTGIAIQKPESYSFGGGNIIRLRGYGLSHLLYKMSGAYATPTFTGTSKSLIEYWCTQAGIECSLSYTDPIFMTTQSIAYLTALDGVNSLQHIIGPMSVVYFDSEGRLVFSDVAPWSADDVEFEYTEGNLWSLGRALNMNKITTVALVTGSTAAASKTSTAASTLIDKYGRNKIAIASGLITTATQATNLASDLLERGTEWINPIQISMPLNPYVTLTSNISVRDLSQSATPVTQIRPERVTHTFRANESQETRVEGTTEYSE